MMESRLLARLSRKKAQLDMLRPLPNAAVQKLRDKLMIEWIYNSNAIEGSTLSLRETQLIVESGLAIGGKSLREHLEVINHKDAIDYVEAQIAAGALITPFHVRQIHRLVLARIDDEGAGQYRTLPVSIVGSEHRPPEAWRIPSLMDDWATWLHGPAAAMHTIDRAALAHHRLVAIHPFIDGNGRTARLVLNLLLMQEGYPPTIIQRVNRRQYYRALALADEGKIAPLVNLVGRAVERSLTLYLESCTPRAEPVPAEEEWISLRQAAQGTPYSQEYLSLLARKGRLEAIKRGRVWYTTSKALESYLQSVAQKE